MNTYLIPTMKSYECTYDYYTCVHAKTAQEAYQAAISLPQTKDYDRIVDTNQNNYMTFKNKLKIPKLFFHKSEKSDIIISLLKQQYQKNGETKMSDLLYDFIYMKDYNRNITDLVNMAIPEMWSFQTENNNSILKNYLSRTLERLQEEHKVITTEKFCAFNTGLYTPNYESIYLLAEKNTNENINEIIQKEWVFKEFCTEYNFDTTDILTLPERADYFTDPSLLLFDWHYPVRVQYGHILDNERNINRLPEYVANSKMKLQLFSGAVDTSIKKVIANYKLAVPQYYDGQIQLLIPLFFEDDNKPDLALAVTKKNGYYQGHTCLTLDMAYNNARLIAKPESNWLTI